MKLRLEPVRAKPLRGPDGAAGRDGVDGSAGRDGEPGRDGVDGKSVTLDDVLPLVEQLVEQLVEKIPRPRNGENGRAGQNGRDGAKGEPGARGTAGRDGASGFNGWPPQLAVVADGERRVHQVVDWVGGEGPAPEPGWYIGPKGPVKSAAEATDLRGAAGHVGWSRRAEAPPACSRSWLATM